MIRLSIVILSIISCFAAGTSQQQVVSQGVEIYFKVGRHNLDRNLSGNGERLDAFGSEWSRMMRDGVKVDSVTVAAYASPEGRSDFNARLAVARMETIACYLQAQMGIAPEIIRRADSGIAWQRLYDMVAADSNVPDRENVLDIIANTPVWVYDAAGTSVVDSRKKRLMELNGGSTYRWLLDNIFPQLRHSAAIAIYGTAPEPVHAPVATIDWRLDVPQLPVSTVMTHGIRPPPAQLLTSTEDLTLKRFAVKTNLLYDAALMPSLEFEWMINSKWSASVEGSCAWWKHTPFHKYYQLLMVVPEAKFWFRTRKAWHGMYAGIFIGAGKYDLENGGTGYKGEGALAGVSYGYSWTLNRHLAIEAAIGLGFLCTRYKEYTPQDSHYVYQYTRTLMTPAPVRVKLAVAYRFYETLNSKKGGLK